MGKECSELPLGHSICNGSEISASLSFGCGADDYKCSLKNNGLKVVQFNCIRVEVVFCVSRQLLRERTNFQVCPNVFYCEKM